MIFVTVGTHEQPFNRLIQKVDELKKDGVITEDVIIQTGFSTYEPKYCQWSKLIPYQQMIKNVADARIVITHGGPASFIMPLQIGKTPIVVPRQHQFNEHVNDHQVEFARNVAKRMGTIIEVEDIETLGDVITNYDQIVAGMPMQTINLKQYYPFCKEDIFVEVSDEIVEAFLLDKRAEAARERKMFRYKAFYSLDCNDGIENAAIGWAQPLPEDYLIEKEELAEYEELIRRLYEAISSLPPMQARRVHARYMLGMKVKDIAAMEGITPSQAGKSIHAALRRLRRYFVRQKWTVNL